MKVIWGGKKQSEGLVDVIISSQAAVTTLNYKTFTLTSARQ